MCGVNRFGGDSFCGATRGNWAGLRGAQNAWYPYSTLTVVVGKIRVKGRLAMVSPFLRASGKGKTSAHQITDFS